MFDKEVIPKENSPQSLPFPYLFTLNQVLPSITLLSILPTLYCRPLLGRCLPPSWPSAPPSAFPWGRCTPWGNETVASCDPAPFSPPPA